ncbi:uncharacterized protein LOC6583900 isoform X2 [Drosophila mojavensis]|uniref:uncharacterized protein LOC6583900 isoform X2 n=1 Tax=Drosophila mojavensis TaxID=7230 RepID=UPI001CD14078|nr:uncharacterized protein LOC6583900 isoform X2 [Drosophila mojavensis]
MDWFLFTSYLIWFLAAFQNPFMEIWERLEEARDFLRIGYMAEPSSNNNRMNDSNFIYSRPIQMIDEPFADAFIGSSYGGIGMDEAGFDGPQSDGERTGENNNYNLPLFWVKLTKTIKMVAYDNPKAIYLRYEADYNGRTLVTWINIVIVSQLLWLFYALIAIIGVIHVTMYMSCGLLKYLANLILKKIEMSGLPKKLEMWIFVKKHELWALLNKLEMLFRSKLEKLSFQRIRQLFSKKKNDKDVPPVVLPVLLPLERYVECCVESGLESDVESNAESITQSTKENSASYRCARTMHINARYNPISKRSKKLNKQDKFIQWIKQAPFLNGNSDSEIRLSDSDGDEHLKLISSKESDENFLIPSDELKGKPRRNFTVIHNNSSHTLASKLIIVSKDNMTDTETPFKTKMYINAKKMCKILQSARPCGCPYYDHNHECDAAKNIPESGQGDGAWMREAAKRNESSEVLGKQHNNSSGRLFNRRATKDACDSDVQEKYYSTEDLSDACTVLYNKQSTANKQKLNRKDCPLKPKISMPIVHNEFNNSQDKDSFNMVGVLKTSKSPSTMSLPTRLKDIIPLTRSFGRSMMPTSFVEEKPEAVIDNPISISKTDNADTDVSCDEGDSLETKTPDTTIYNDLLQKQFADALRISEESETSMSSHSFKQEDGNWVGWSVKKNRSNKCKKLMDVDVGMESANESEAKMDYSDADEPMGSTFIQQHVETLKDSLQGGYQRPGKKVAKNINWA